jgi:D-arabinose 1-dehydrogenase-like Zn-dependent alcohol dehydrogenase
LSREKEARMQAALLVEPKRVEIQQVPTPSPGRGKVFVRVKEAGICVNAIVPGFFKTKLTESV